jgi:hypothetical protein
VSERAAEREPGSAERPERAEPAIFASPASVVERMQRTAGNAAVARLLQRDDVETWVPPGYGEAFEAALKDEITSKFTVTISGAWSDPDLTDLKAALGLLTSTELSRVSGTRFVRVAALPNPDDDALTEVASDGSSKKVSAADTLFGREPGKSGGRTVYGQSLGAHGLVHECGHVIHFPDASYEPVLKLWKPIYDRLKKAGTKISSEPKGNPAKYVDYEVLAEAFARFHTDPTGLKSDDAGTHDFFSSGKHLKTA